MIERGGRYVPRTGWIRIGLESLHGSVTVRVIEGEWSLDHADWVGIMSIEDMELDGRTAHCPADRVVSWEGAQKGIEASWTPPAWLVASDARTGEELSELVVHCSDKFNPDTRPPRSEDDLRPRSTPVKLSAWEPEDDNLGWPHVSRRTWWVKAPGYAWSRVEVDHSVGGEVRVALRRARARSDR